MRDLDSERTYVLSWRHLTRRGPGLLRFEQSPSPGPTQQNGTKWNEMERSKSPSAPALHPMSPCAPPHVTLSGNEGSGGARHPGWSATSSAYPQGRGGAFLLGARASPPAFRALTTPNITLRPTQCHPEAAAEGSGGAGHPGWSAARPAYPQGRGGRSYWERGRPRPHSGHSPHPMSS